MVREVTKRTNIDSEQFLAQFQPETPDAFLKFSELIKLIKVPELKYQPHFLIFIGPPRSGTTAVGTLLAHHKDISTVSFQPIKGRLRNGSALGEYVIPKKSSDNDIIFAKETYGPSFDAELLDPVEILLKAGFDPSKITVISALRNPIDTFSSIKSFIDRPSIQFFRKTIEHTISMHNKWMDAGIRAVPFVYELLSKGDELGIIQRMIELASIDPVGLDSLDFSADVISHKVDWGEGDLSFNSDYYNRIIIPTISRKQFKFIKGKTHRDEYSQEELKVLAECMKLYKNFALKTSLFYL